MAATLAFHTAPNANSVAVVRAAKSAQWIKVCAPGDVARAKLAGATKVYLRPYLDGDDGDCTDGVTWAKEVGSAITQLGGVWPEALGFRNECSAGVQTAVQYLRYRDALRSLGYRGLVVLGSFGVGKPDWPEWANLKAGLAGYAPDAVELHEYWGDHCGDNAPYYEWRHVEAIKRGLLPSTWPLIIGEINRDSPPGNAPGGWQGAISADQQIANLAAYRAGCAPSVVAAFVFVDGDTSGKWTSYATFGTSVEAAIRATWQSADIQTIENPASGPEPATVVERLGHMNPSPLFKFDQGPGTLDCWVECIRSFFLRYGYPLDLDTVFQAGKGHARPAGGEAATFAEVKQAITRLAQQLGVQLQSMDCDTPTVVFQALRDPNASNPWTVIAGVAEQDLQPGQQYGHFMILSGFQGGNEISVVDPLDHYDGNTSGVYPAATLATAMIDNWEPAIDAEAVKIVGKAA